MMMKSLINFERWGIFVGWEKQIKYFNKKIDGIMIDIKQRVEQKPSLSITGNENMLLLKE